MIVSRHLHTDERRQIINFRTLYEEAPGLRLEKEHRRLRHRGLRGPWAAVHYRVAASFTRNITKRRAISYVGRPRPPCSSLFARPGATLLVRSLLHSAVAAAHSQRPARGDIGIVRGIPPVLLMLSSMSSSPR